MTALLLDHKKESYEAMMLFWLEMLNLTDNRLSSTVRAKGDYEVGPRSKTRSTLQEYGYNVVIEGELFHFTKSLWKRIGLFHLKGLYMFNNGGDSSYFNPFRFLIQLLFCITLLPHYAVKKTYLYIKPQLATVHTQFQYRDLTITKASCKKSIAELIDYFERVWMGDESHTSKYSIRESNNYLNSVRTTNSLETWHNQLRRAVGIKEDIFDFLKGIQQLEQDSVVQFWQYLEHGFKHKRRKIYIEREKLLNTIWQKCEDEIDTYEDPEDIEAEFWFDILMEMQELFYTAKNNIIANIDHTV